MSTHVPGFRPFLRFFASYCIGQISQVETSSGSMHYSKVIFRSPLNPVLPKATLGVIGLTLLFPLCPYVCQINVHISFSGRILSYKGFIVISTKGLALH